MCGLDGIIKKVVKRYGILTLGLLMSVVVLLMVLILLNESMGLIV